MFDKALAEYFVQHYSFLAMFFTNMTIFFYSGLYKVNARKIAIFAALTFLLFILIVFLLAYSVAFIYSVHAFTAIPGTILLLPFSYLPSLPFYLLGKSLSD